MKDPKQMTGLELLTAMRDGVLPSASIGKTMPMQSVEVTQGTVTFKVKAGAGYGTIDLNIKMCRPIPKNKELQATGTLINLSKNLGIAEGKIFDEEGKLYAFATATCMILCN